MPTSVAQLQQWLLEPEGQRLEFKEAKQHYHFEKLLKYCVALANEGGGIMVLGVTDKRPRRIVGTQAFEDPGRTEAGLHQRLGHRIPVEEMRLPEGRVLIVHVPPRLSGTAWNVDGSYFKRAGDDLAPLVDHELRAMFAEGGPDFSAQPCSGATLADLEPESIALFRERWARKSGDLRKRDLNDQQTLRDAELLVEVYLAMTRGQESLIIDLEPDSAAVRAAAVMRAPGALRGVRVSEAERAEHERVLAEIDKASGGATVWRRLEPVPAD